MYDTLIAETLSEDSPKPKSGILQSQTTLESWDSPERNGTIPSLEDTNSNLLKMNTMDTLVVDPKAAVPGDTLCPITNGQNVPLRTLAKNESPVTPQHQYKLGLLSRSFSKWSSRITDKSASPTANRNGKGNQRKTTVVSPGIQRPLSVNSTFSSTSTSSCSSESSASLTSNNAVIGERKAPKASPEEDDIVPADMSDEEGSSGSMILPGGKGVAAAQKNPAIERCFSKTSTPKDCGDSGRTRISYPMSPQGKPKFYDPNLSYMDRVVMEIVETERVYVTDLQEIISSYLGHWRSCEEDEKPKELEDITELFSNIEEIHAFNSEFVTQLEGCGLDPVQVAKCFVTQNEGFSVYTQYCTHYPRTMFILTEMMRKEKSAKYFRERQASLGHSLPLGSYLLKPVQRILKYHLLLQNIVKHYDGEEEGYSAIVEALSAMTNIAHNINDMKRRHEHAVRVQEIQSLLYGWQGEDLTTYGELCAEGTFRVYGAKALRHVFLFDKMLLITKKKEDGILSYKSHIMCSNLMLIESVPGELLSFHVIPFDNPRLQCTLQAKNSEQKREWTLQLKRVILENYHAVIPIHARQLVMELGQCRPGDGSFLSEKVQTKRQHSAPEYLERRKQEKDRRKAESTLKAKLRRARKNDPISPKEGLIMGRRSSRRTSMDSNISTTPDDCSRVREINGIDPKMSISSCPVGPTEKLLVKKLSGWRRKSEPDFYLNGLKGSGKVSNGLTSPAHGNSQLTIDYVESIGEETGGEEVDEDEDSARQNDLPEGSPNANTEQRRESVEEIVGQLVMQNREFQRILSKRRMVHLRRASTQSQQRATRREGDESGSDAETEDSMGTPAEKLMDVSQASSSSNGIGSSSDVNEDSIENISSRSKDEDVGLHSKNVQRTVSDPGNKSTLTPRRFISGPFSHYDPISLLWSSFRRNDSNRRSNNSASTKESETNEIKSSNGNPSIRHTHSFTCSRKDPHQRSPTESKASETLLPHGDSGVFPNSFTSDSSSSSEANIPTLPAVWLKQQHEHLATPSTKSGSLPRSFQVGQHQPSPLNQMSGDNRRAESPGKSRLRDSGKYPVPDRPFTIASDKPSPSDMSYDEMEQYMSKFNEQLTKCVISEDIDELTTTEITPITSMDNLSLHPDHKIYHRSSKSSIKHILLSVTHRLSGLKANRMSTTKGVQVGTNPASTGTKTPVNFGSYPNISFPANGSLDKTNNESSSLLSRQDKKSLKQRVKDRVVKEDSDSENCDSITSSGFGSIGSSVSSTNNLNSKKIGARLAHCSEVSEYSLSKLQGSGFDDVLRPLSVMSASSTVTSSSSAGGGGGDEQFLGESITDYPGVFLRRNGGKRITHRDLYLSYIDQDGDEIDGSLSDSDGSAGSFYERSFEAIENFFDSEVFPDSAIYSDQDDLITTSTPNPISPESKGSDDSVGNKERLSDRWNFLHLPVVNGSQNGESSRPSRVICSQAILEKLKHLEQCTQFQRDCLPSPSFEGIKSIQQRRKELELWKTGLGNREDESETSSQHSTSTINTVIELSPSKSTSFPSSRRCSDTESSGGNSPLTERAVSRSSNRSHSQGHLCIPSSDTKSKGWVKLVVGKLEGEGESS